jgi:anti-sigma factor ChrR (cupin superfamily)
MKQPEGAVCDKLEQIGSYALGCVPAVEASGLEAHITACAQCRQELASLRPVVESFAAWSPSAPGPSSSVWDRLAQRVCAETGAEPLSKPPGALAEPQWQEVAPGISCKLLATDTDRNRVSMLVRLAPDVQYPAHCHAGVEELHLLDGVLVIDRKTLYPGDYYRAEGGSVDTRVWSETGCTCVLITSPLDELR